MKPLMSVADRLARHVQLPVTDDGCWEWTGYRNAKGYGCIGRIQGKTMLAHRTAWEVDNGPIPNGMNVCHHCDNPGCIRPSHLFLGTQSDNVRDAARKGRTWPQRYGVPTGDANWNAKVPDKTVTLVRRLYADGFATVPELVTLFALPKKYIQGVVYGNKRKAAIAEEL